MPAQHGNSDLELGRQIDRTGLYALVLIETDKGRAVRAQLGRRIGGDVGAQEPQEVRQLGRRWFRDVFGVVFEELNRLLVGDALAGSRSSPCLPLGGTGEWTASDPLVAACLITIGVVHDSSQRLGVPGQKTPA